MYSMARANAKIGLRISRMIVDYENIPILEGRKCRKQLNN